MEHCYALIVGIEQYLDAVHFASLPFAQADAESLYRLLVDPERGGWRTENVVYVAGEDATRDEIESQLRELCLVRAQANDLIVIYFAGHALLDPATLDGYLTLRATQAERPATGLHIPSLVDHYLVRFKSWQYPDHSGYRAHGRCVETCSSLQRCRVAFRPVAQRFAAR